MSIIKFQIAEQSLLTKVLIAPNISFNQNTFSRESLKFKWEKSGKNKIFEFENEEVKKMHYRNVYCCGVLSILNKNLFFAATLFFLGMFYRSASLYHPQRRAILHIKDMSKKKGKDKNKIENKPPYFDFSTLRMKSLQGMLIFTLKQSCISSLVKGYLSCICGFNFALSSKHRK